MIRRKVAASLALGLLCCIGGSAAQSSYDCAEDGLIFDCEQPPPAAPPCAADAQRAWVVETSAQAQALAAAVNCSGGSFDVEWRGTVIVDEPIYVVNGTVLTVTGAAADSHAAIDGNFATRLFTVVNASLRLSGVNITSGAGVAVGGAVAAAGSTLTLNRTNFVGNTATGSGGAVYVSDGSSVTLVGGETSTFADNAAASHGGAFYATGGSVVSWVGEARFLDNSCGGYGGGLAVEASAVMATGNAVFLGNVAEGITGYGGAMNAFSGSSVVWGGDVTRFQDNFAGGGGGAMSIAWASEMSWSGPFQFSGNNASGNGGALLVSSSTASWDGHAEFAGNTATYGGAVYVNNDSNVSWTGVTEFFNNTVEKFGGAVAAQHSTVLSSGNTTFSSNRAWTAGAGFGGAVNAGVSKVTFGGDTTTFQDNMAGNGGGAIAAAWSSEVSCTRTCRFSGNTATTGGALTVSGSTVSWSADTALVGNAARFGGALFIYNGSRVSWTGDTEFSSNEAWSDGGAISTPLSGVSYSPLDSALVINGTTTFTNNTSGVSGGALALLGGCSVDIGGGGGGDGTAEVVFVNNTAGVAGGALFLSSTGFGPTFPGVSFVSNSAQVGGAVSAVGSGTTKDTIDVEASNPTTFDGCQFLDNMATATGGAVESAAGQDAYLGTLFEGNRAGTGGALRLAGTSSVDNCSFVENVSGDGGGAAMSNIGFISKMSNVSFSGNVFDCEPGTFLDFNVSGDAVASRALSFRRTWRPRRLPQSVSQTLVCVCIRGGACAWI